MRPPVGTQHELTQAEREHGGEAWARGSPAAQHQSCPSIYLMYSLSFLEDGSPFHFSFTVTDGSVLKKAPLFKHWFRLEILSRGFGSEKGASPNLSRCAL